LGNGAKNEGASQNIGKPHLGFFFWHFLP